MFEAFYGLSKKPFSKTPDPEFLYLSRAHREALARLKYGVEEREIVVLTGEVGAGKTTLSRCLMDSLDERFKIINIVAPLFSQGELLRLFAIKLGVENPSQYRTELIDEIGTKLFEFYQAGVCPVLIVDEGQLIPGNEGLDELRLITNLQLDDANLLSLVLLGQPELKTRLMSGYFEPFRQRIGIQYHIPALGFEETKEYIAFRLKRAGREEPLFTEAALEAIYRFSGGIPRKINNLSSNSIIVGFGREDSIIDSEVVVDVARDFGFINWKS
ncbi:MAG: AAA family ATPase [Deltaproteobacteria bacterium]|nr:AAA family ATPase [Deltaproteobacteria bacterium]